MSLWNTARAWRTASRSPWHNYEKPLHSFLLIRAEACREAVRPKVVR